MRSEAGRMETAGRKWQEKLGGSVGISSCFCTSLIGNLNIISLVIFSYSISHKTFKLLTTARENSQEDIHRNHALLTKKEDHAYTEV
jgi:hypothetical protein